MEETSWFRIDARYHTSDAPITYFGANTYQCDLCGTNYTGQPPHWDIRLINEYSDHASAQAYVCPGCKMRQAASSIDQAIIALAEYAILKAGYTLEAGWTANATLNDGVMYKSVLTLAPSYEEAGRSWLCSNNPRLTIMKLDAPGNHPLTMELIQSRLF